MAMWFIFAHSFHSKKIANNEWITHYSYLERNVYASNHYFWLFRHSVVPETQFLLLKISLLKADGNVYAFTVEHMCMSIFIHTFTNFGIDNILYVMHYMWFYENAISIRVKF